MIDTEPALMSTESEYDPLDTRALGLFLTVAGAVGLLAAFVLTRDKIDLLEHPGSFNPSCNLNAFVSCTGVMQSPQSEAFGFANSLLGIIGFSVVATLGVLVASRVRLPGWVWLGLQVGVLFGVCFVTWLQYQSIYSIGKLCPYCVVVWAAMIPLFVIVTVRNLRAVAPDHRVVRFLRDWTTLVIALWFVAVLAAIWFHFGSNLWA